MPNLTMLRDFGTDLFANIDHNGTEDGTLVVQWPWQAQPPAQPPRNEVFYLHPVVE
jgi:hypothetical protein